MLREFLQHLPVDYWTRVIPRTNNRIRYNMTIVRKKLYRVGFFPRFNVLSQLHSAKHFKFLQTMNTDRGRERGLEIEMCLLTFSQIMEVCLSWLELSQHILLPIVDQTYPNASKHFKTFSTHFSVCKWKIVELYLCSETFQSKDIARRSRIVTS